MQTLLLMRHAQSLGNEKQEAQGQSDFPLSTQGRLQVKRSIPVLRSLAPSHLYSSPLQRAVEHTALIARELDLDFSVLPELTDRDLGTWEGLPQQELRRMWADHEHPFRSDPHFAPPQGESLVEVDQRVQQAVTSLRDPKPLIISHLAILSSITFLWTTHRIPSKNAEILRLCRKTSTVETVFSPREENASFSKVGRNREIETRRRVTREISQVPRLR